MCANLSKGNVNFKIGKEGCGLNAPTFIIAELSANHLQKFNNAVRLIKAAKLASADAVKLQTYLPDTLTIDSRNKYFMIKHKEWGNQTLFELYKKAYTPWSWFRKLKKVADDLDIILFSTAFDKKSVDLLEEISVPFYKVASFEIVDLALIEYIARTKKPVMISTGMASIPEIRDAVQTARKYGAKEVILMKCTSSYPASPSDINLRTISHMERLFRCPVGFSDHTLGIGVSVAAVSLGARFIEKHFTLSRKTKSPDSFFSLEPAEFKNMVENIRIVEKALGKVRYGATKGEKGSLVFRRSLFAVNDIKTGELLTQDNIRSIRPAYGLLPKELNGVLGKRAKKDIEKGTPLRRELIF